jgi:hypothetical protein
MRKRKEGNEDKIELVYKTTIRYECPKRGWVEEEVEVKRFKAATPPDGAALDIELDQTLTEVED